MSFTWPVFEARIVGSFIAHTRHAHTPRRSDELALTKGDLVCLWDRRCATWWAGVNLRTGQTGYFPSNFVCILGEVGNSSSKKYNDRGPPLLPPSELDGLKAKALQLHRVQSRYEEDEFTLNANDVVVVIDTRDGWHMGYANGRTGIFPSLGMSTPRHGAYSTGFMKGTYHYFHVAQSVTLASLITGPVQRCDVFDTRGLN
ncbi:SH3-domain kinase binding protein 1 [Dimargaris cristalligena]|nr:SH3-domain kinase binding protein 1 [Dimargaris cristalligena]